MQKVLVGIAVAILLTLVTLSIYNASERRTKIQLSNEMLASLQRTPAAVNPVVYSTYVGVYEIEPDFNITITTDGEHLFAQGSNQIRVELFPANQTTFYNEYTEALITFEPHASGKSKRFMLQQINQLREGNRIEHET